MHCMPVHLGVPACQGDYHPQSRTVTNAVAAEAHRIHSCYRSTQQRMTGAEADK